MKTKTKIGIGIAVVIVLAAVFAGNQGLFKGSLFYSPATPGSRTIPTPTLKPTSAIQVQPTTALNNVATQKPPVDIVRPAPKATLTVNPSTINWNDPVQLTWTTTDATDVTIQNVEITAPDGTVTVGSKKMNPNGSLTVYPYVENVAGATKTYSLTATGNGGSVNATASVTVLPKKGSISFSFKEGEGGVYLIGQRAEGKDYESGNFYLDIFKYQERTIDELRSGVKPITGQLLESMHRSEPKQLVLDPGVYLAEVGLNQPKPSSSLSSIENGFIMGNCTLVSFETYTPPATERAYWYQQYTHWVRFEIKPGQDSTCRLKLAS